MKTSLEPRSPSPRISALTLGLGTIVTDGYGEKNAAGFASLLMAAAAAGITHVDTAGAYGRGESEHLLGAYMHELQLDFRVCTKIGLVDGEPSAGRDSLWRQAEAALSRLQTSRVDTLLLHRPDPGVSLERSMETLCAIREAGFAARIGFSNVETIAAIGLMQRGLADVVQTSWSLLDARQARLLEAAGDLGVRRMVFGVLAFGILAGSVRLDTAFDGTDWRGIARSGRDPGTNGAPLFLDDTFDKAVSRAGELEALAQLSGLSLAAATVAASLALAPAEQIIVGCRTPEELTGLLGAVDSELSGDILRTGGALAVL